MTLPRLRCETDSAEYEKLHAAALETLTLPGASLEFGVRAGGSTELILRARQGTNHPHIGVDPWGGLPYRMGTQTMPYTYPDDMRRKTLSDLHAVALELHSDLLLFPMKDTDFFDAFPNGVPFYREGGPAHITSFSLIFFDGEHTPDAVMPEVVWCAPRTNVGGQWVFDDVRSYPHVEAVEPAILAHGFERLYLGPVKAVYRKL